MLSLAAPLWLLGLALLPAIRWLHRGGRHRRALPVSHLGLWQGAAAQSPAAGEKQPPDPAWRRRALLAALLLLALAEPRLAPPQAVTLWVDDSLSMLTREAQGTRLSLAMAQASALLADRPRADIEVRVLSDPWRRLGTPGDLVLAAVTVALEARLAGTAGPEPTAPPATLLRADREHWLLTDGAHPALSQWPAGRQADRVVQVGSLRRNVGVATLAARRSPDDADRVDVLIKLSNGGDAVESRELVIVSGANEAARSSQRLAPGASVMVTAQVAASDRVRATLQPADALAADDELVLDLAPLRRRRVAVDARCPVALRLAVAAHPALSPAAPDFADAAFALALALDCGGGGPAGQVPTVRVRDGDAPRRPPGPAQWSAALPAPQRIRLEPGQLPVAASLKLQPGDAVLLALGDDPVIVSRAGTPPRIETSLDFSALSAARGPETPLLLNLMFERLLGGDLLGATVGSGRGAAASFVVPAVMPAGAGGTAAGAASVAPVPARTLADPRTPGTDTGTRPVLWVALLTLLWEIAALCRQWFRIGRHAPAAPT